MQPIHPMPYLWKTESTSGCAIAISVMPISLVITIESSFREEMEPVFMAIIISKPGRKSMFFTWLLWLTRLSRLSAKALKHYG